MYLPDILTEMVGKKNLSNGNEAQGCREKKPPNCHKYATFWGGFFNFMWTKKIKIPFENIFASALKVASYKPNNV